MEGPVAVGGNVCGVVERTLRESFYPPTLEGGGRKSAKPDTGYSIDSNDSLFHRHSHLIIQAYNNHSANGEHVDVRTLIEGLKPLLVMRYRGRKLDADLVNSECQDHINVAIGMFPRQKSIKWIDPLAITVAFEYIPGWDKTQCHLRNTKALKSIRTAEAANLLRAMGLFPRAELRACEMSSEVLAGGGLDYTRLYDTLASKYDIVMFPVHGRDHWSLLVWYLGADGKTRIYHYDSLRPLNRQFALAISQCLMSIGFLGADSIMKEPVQMNQQTGDWECGHSVIILTRSVCAHYMKEHAAERRSHRHDHRYEPMECDFPTKVVEKYSPTPPLPEHMFPEISEWAIQAFWEESYS